MRKLSSSLALIPVIFLSVAAVCAADPPKNGIFLDLNPSILALVYLPMDMKAFGLEAGYERDISGRFGGMIDVKYLRISVEEILFQVWDISLYGRYALWRDEKSTFFTSFKFGALLYDSPYYQGGSFLTGLEISWRKILRAHFLLEPYINISVCADDRHLMPFTAFALTEHLIPGFNTGVRFGISF
ncbi:MAG: hypothetical protein LBQ88_14460 [Treponema sp.]|nr:hypothetical protein [Treponema sp.]